MACAFHFSPDKKPNTIKNKTSRYTVFSVFINSLTASSKKSFVLLLIFFITDCSSFASKIKLIDSSASLAFFEVEEDEWRKIFPNEVSKLNIDTIKFTELPNVLKSIQYKRGVLAYEDWEVLVPEAYLPEIQKFAEKVVTNKEPKVYLCIFKLDDILAPNVKILKTSFYILGTEEGLVLLFHEINTNISFQTQYSFEDWVIFHPSPIKPIYRPELWLRDKQHTSLYKDKLVSKNGIYGNVVVYQIPELIPNPPLYKYPKEEEVIAPVEQWKSVPEKLKALEEMRKNQLITDEEYNRKKTELLKEF
ncbi:membrane protein, PF09851 family [Leptospira wolbachii serovar Codice str. CDC]|uniref:Membrane protein, PF09851 family n=1 Tax=Leptospira wolbachii serovar Codice str. CDC TaxID=1218599 RepID=R8ZZM7_9LEPT|nr:membrane protein, PF09851 family [Leptospira wolbachii serovar Codice str. CDC]